MKLLKAFLAMLFGLLILDAIWIGAVMGDLYQQELGDRLKASPDLVAALVFYLGYPLGALYLCVRPAVKDGSLRQAALSGAVLGAVAYGTFAVTNLSVLEGWSLTLTVVDCVWGACVTAATAAIGFTVARR